MTTNLSPGFLAAEVEFKKANTDEERLAALEEMLSTIPKHKGTEKMCADIKRRISKLKESIEEARSSTKKGISHHIPKDGVAQCVLVGAPNSGKSSLLNTLTAANASVGDFPFTTTRPQPGMMPFQNISFQIIDLPAVSEEFMEPWVMNLVRVADCILLLAPLDDLDSLDPVIGLLKASRIEFAHSFTEADYHSPTVTIPVIVIGTKSDIDESGDLFAFLRELYPAYSAVPISILQPDAAETIGSILYKTLDFIRVYSKAPGKTHNPDQPIVLHHGATVIDAALEIHKDFAENLKYARVWGDRTFEGQRVQRDYTLSEGDIIEFKI